MYSICQLILKDCSTPETDPTVIGLRTTLNKQIQRQHILIKMYGTRSKNYQKNSFKESKEIERVARSKTRR